MRQIFYASSNASKIRNLKNWLAGEEIRIFTPADLPCRIEVEESGLSVIENAVLKVEAYVRLLKQLPPDHPCGHLPVLAHDTGLYLEGVPEQEQPGIHVRRYYQPDEQDPARLIEKSMSDQEALLHYCRIAHEHGGRIKARYFRGAALQTEKGLFTLEVDSPSMWILDTPCHPYTEKGNPLDVSTIDIATGKYWCDLTASERDAAYGFLGSKIASFIREHVS